MKKFFSYLGFDPKKHFVKTEVLAGLTTFMTMSYILAVNPLILSAAGMDRGAVFSATVISAAIATLLMAFYAKMPFAQASGMGLNAFFAYTLVLMMGYSWQEALAAVFVEGIFFILLTIFHVRQAIVDSTPQNLRYALSVGIGLFIAYLGLKNGDIIIANEENLTVIGPLTATSGLATIGILLGAVLIRYKVKGALFFTIIITTIIGIPMGVTKLPEGFSIFSMPISIEPIAMKMDFHHFLTLDLKYYIVVLTMLLMDIFDTIGTLIGTIESAGMKDKNGQMPELSKKMKKISESWSYVRNIHSNHLCRKYYRHCRRWTNWSHGIYRGSSLYSVALPGSIFPNHPCRSHNKRIGTRGNDDAESGEEYQLYRHHRTSPCFFRYHYYPISSKHRRRYCMGRTLLCTRKNTRRQGTRVINQLVYNCSYLRV